MERVSPPVARVEATRTQVVKRVGICIVDASEYLAVWCRCDVGLIPESGRGEKKVVDCRGIRGHPRGLK